MTNNQCTIYNKLTLKNHVDFFVDFSVPECRQIRIVVKLNFCSSFLCGWWSFIRLQLMTVSCNLLLFQQRGSDGSR